MKRSGYNSDFVHNLECGVANILLDQERCNDWGSKELSMAHLPLCNSVLVLSVHCTVQSFDLIPVALYVFDYTDNLTDQKYRS